MSEQLDLWIAERLFGFDPTACTCWLSGDKKTVVLDEFCPQHGDTTPLGPPRYSSTGEGMLAVLEAMKGRGFVGGLGLPPPSMTTYDARFYDEAAARGIAHARSAPLAVALAAKATLERAALEAESR